jgi:hypothetical protein
LTTYLPRLRFFNTIAGKWTVKREEINPPELGGYYDENYEGGESSVGPST